LHTLIPIDEVILLFTWRRNRADADLDDSSTLRDSINSVYISEVDDAFNAGNIIGRVYKQTPRNRVDDDVGNDEVAEEETVEERLTLGKG